MNEMIIYFSQLPKKTQTQMLNEIKELLISEGIYTEDEIQVALNDALCSKLDDVLYLL